MEIEWFRVLGEPGWVELFLSGEHQLRLLARFEERDERAVLTCLVTAGDDLDAATLRAVPYGRIGAVVNHPTLGMARGIFNELPADALEDLAGRGEIFPAQARAIAQAVDSISDAPVKGAPKVTRRRVERKPLQRPDGTDPDRFYRDVAERYNELVTRTKAPAKALADDANVPVTSVHRWIREARTRGFLPAARKGRAG